MELTTVLAMSATSGFGSADSCSSARHVLRKMFPYDVENRLEMDDEDETRFIGDMSSLGCGAGLRKLAERRRISIFVSIVFMKSTHSKSQQPD